MQNQNFFTKHQSNIEWSHEKKVIPSVGSVLARERGKEARNKENETRKRKMACVIVVTEVKRQEKCGSFMWGRGEHARRRETWKKKDKRGQRRRRRVVEFIQIVTGCTRQSH